MKSHFLFFILLLLVFTPIISSPFGYDNPTLPSLTQELFDDKPSSFYMPNNLSVFGNFSFNGDCLDGGIELRNDGTICGQKLEVFNITSLNITKQDLTIIESLNIFGNFTVDTNTLFVDSNSNNVGIGTTNLGVEYDPTRLQLGDNTQIERLVIATNRLAEIYFDDDTAGYFGTIRYDNGGLMNEFHITTSNNGDGRIRFSTKDSEAMRITGAGDVGIGMITPSEKLHVAGNIFLQNDSDKLYFGQGKDVSISYTGTNTIFTNEVGSGAWIFDSGNVGIGTTNPQNKLNVIGSINQTQGNLTGDLIVGQMWFDDATSVTTIIAVQNTWYNVTGFNSSEETGQYLHSVVYNNDTEDLEILLGGAYEVSNDESYGNAGNNEEYEFTFGVNSVPQTCGKSHRKVGSGGDVGDSGDSGCYISLSTGDRINLMVRNKDGTADLLGHFGKVKIMRIGN